MTELDERLRRRLRAMTAVNRDLQVQLEGRGPVSNDADPALTAARHRRGRASEMLDQLEALDPDPQPYLAREPDGTTHVVDAGTRRRIRSGLLATALEAPLGERRSVSRSEIERLREGPTVEVFEGPDGPPFVVVGGRRLPLGGLPLPYPASPDQIAAFPNEGPTISVAVRGIVRARMREAVSVGSVRIGWARARRTGRRVLPSARRTARRTWRRIRRTTKRLATSDHAP